MNFKRVLYKHYNIIMAGTYLHEENDNVINNKINLHIYTFKTVYVQNEFNELYNDGLEKPYVINHYLKRITS